MNQLAFAKLVNFVSTDIVQLGEVITIINVNNEFQFYISNEIPLETLTNSHTARNFYNWLSTLINIKLEHGVQPLS